MRQYRVFRGYTLADQRFYEDLDHFLPDGDIERRVRALESADVKTTRRGPWVACRPANRSLPAHGWKIHVSTVPDHAHRALEIILREFARDPFHFKCLRDRRIVTAATSRWWQTGQVGKVITIYPTDTDDCRELLERLDETLVGVEGPYILTDRRYRESSCVFYRYGGFTRSSRTEPDGTQTPILHGPSGQQWADDRSPVYRTPPWVDELFALPTTEPPSRDIHGYRVTNALHHTGAGGVYLAERISDGRVVVLKESRPHTAFAADGTTGQERLRREFDTLNLLRDSGVGPEPIELFLEWEHLFLAEEYVDFGPLTTFTAARSPLAHGDLSPESLELYRTQVQTMLTNLRAALAACHERGVCYGDLSMANVLIDPETLSVRLIDFESCRLMAEWTNETQVTPGFHPPPGSDAWLDPLAFDEFGLASIELACVSPQNVLRELNPEALARSVQRAAALLQYPLGDLLERVELPAGEDTSPTDLALIVKEAARFAENTLTPDRADRPFPSSPEVFVTNPWSVAYGVAGMLRGLQRLTGQVHPALQEWMSGNQAGLDTLPPNLYFGMAGVGWTLLDAGMPDEGLELIDRAGRDAPGDLPATIAEGCAGVGLACLAGWLATGQETGRVKAARIGDHLIHTARDSGFGLHWPRSGAKRHPLGYAHGSSGVATFLLYLHLATGEDRFRLAARRALDYDLNQLAPRARTGIGLPGHADHPMQEPYWERGSAGLGGALARFCRFSGDERLRETLDRLVHSTLQGAALFPGLFTGMAGIVNFALDCWHLLGGSEYQKLAAGMADGIIALACPQPEGLAFPGHGLLRYSNDFSSGSIGIALVLDRLDRGNRDFNYTLDELFAESTDA